MPDLVERLTGLLTITVEVFTQRIRLRHLSGVDNIGGPAEGLTCIVTGPTSAYVRRAVALARKRQQRFSDERLTSVRSFAQKWNHRPLHCLVNNAGIFDIGGGQGYTRSVDGLELHMATNYLGPFLLSMLLLPALRQTGTKERPARVVNLASRMSETCTLNMQDPLLSKPHVWNSVYAYSHSKLCQITHTAEMRRRLAHDDRVFVCATDPGLVITNVVRSTPGWIQYLYQRLLGCLLMTPKQVSGQALMLRLARSAIFGSALLLACLRQAYLHSNLAGYWRCQT